MNVRVIPGDLPETDPDREVLLALCAVADALGQGHDGPDSRDLAFGVMVYGDNREVGLGTPFEMRQEVGISEWYVSLLTYDADEADVRTFAPEDTVAAFTCALNALLHGVMEA